MGACLRSTVPGTPADNRTAYRGAVAGRRRAAQRAPTGCPCSLSSIGAPTANRSQLPPSHNSLTGRAGRHWAPRSSPRQQTEVGELRAGISSTQFDPVINMILGATVMAVNETCVVGVDAAVGVRIDLPHVLAPGLAGKYKAGRFRVQTEFAAEHNVPATPNSPVLDQPVSRPIRRIPGKPRGQFARSSPCARHPHPQSTLRSV
jgi:hypothetical protein